MKIPNFANKNRIGAFDWALNGAASIACAAEVNEPIAGHVKLQLRAGISDTDRALTDITQTAIDRLAERRIIKRPACVSDIDARWDRTVEPGRVVVHVWEATPPTRRITAGTRQRIADAQRRRWAAFREARAEARGCHG